MIHPDHPERLRTPAEEHGAGRDEKRNQNERTQNPDVDDEFLVCVAFESSAESNDSSRWVERHFRGG